MLGERGDCKKAFLTEPVLGGHCPGRRNFRGRKFQINNLIFIIILLYFELISIKTKQRAQFIFPYLSPHKVRKVTFK